MPDDFEDFPTPFPIEGRQALFKARQYGDESAPIKLAAGIHRVLVEVDTSLGADPAWRRLVESDLHAQGDALHGGFIAHRNAVDDSDAD